VQATLGAVQLRRAR